MPEEKAEKDQKCLYGFSHFEYENTDPKEYCTSHLETAQTSTKVYNLKAIHNDQENVRTAFFKGKRKTNSSIKPDIDFCEKIEKNILTKHFKEQSQASNCIRKIYGITANVVKYDIKKYRILL